MNEQDFIPGLELSRRYFHDVVQPILDEAFPAVPYSMALIGAGSEVLGFDTPLSTDHHWGLRLMMFLRPTDKEAYSAAISQTLAERLPYQFMGHSTHFSTPNTDPHDQGTQHPVQTDSGPVNHRVELFSLEGYFARYLGIDIHQPPTPAQWLSIPSQRLRSITAGAVYHDGLAADGLGLTTLRERLAYYPHDLWLYMMACSWYAIAELEHLAPRAGHAGDELGAALLGHDIVRHLMQLAFLIERQYAPYHKWFGTAFNRLAMAGELGPLLRQAQLADRWQAREAALVKAYSFMVEQHNALSLTDTTDPSPRPFFSRPFQVIEGWRVGDALRAVITDPAVKAIIDHTTTGNIDQFSPSTVLHENDQLRPAVQVLFSRVD